MAFGARVTAMASAGNLALLRELGAETALDYRTAELAGLGQSFDAVLDTFGALSVRQAWALLRPGGVFVPLNFGLREIVAALWPWARRQAGEDLRQPRPGGGPGGTAEAVGRARPMPGSRGGTSAVRWPCGWADDGAASRVRQGKQKPPRRACAGGWFLQSVAAQLPSPVSVSPTSMAGARYCGPRAASPCRMSMA